MMTLERVKYDHVIYIYIVHINKVSEFKFQISFLYLSKLDQVKTSESNLFWLVKLDSILKFLFYGILKIFSSVLLIHHRSGYRRPHEDFQSYPLGNRREQFYLDSDGILLCDLEQVIKLFVTWHPNNIMKILICISHFPLETTEDSHLEVFEGYNILQI